MKKVRSVNPKVKVDGYCLVFTNAIDPHKFISVNYMTYFFVEQPSPVDIMALFPKVYKTIEGGIDCIYDISELYCHLYHGHGHKSDFVVFCEKHISTYGGFSSVL